MSNRKAHGTLEIAGLKLRGTVTGWNPGKPIREEQVNADKTVDWIERPQAATLTIELSYVADVELDQIAAIENEPAVLRFANGQTVNFPALTFGQSEDVTNEGVTTVRFFGPEVKGV